MTKQSPSQDAIIQAANEFARSIFRLASAITPNICGGPGANGGHIESLTEAVMDASESLLNIARSIESLGSVFERIVESIESLDGSVSDIPDAIQSLQNTLDREAT